MGVKPVFNLTTEDGRSIKTTANHPYLVKNKEDYSLRNFNNLPVEIISTFGCDLNDFSSDQIPQLKANANEKYWMSFLCGLNSSACSANLLKSSNGIVLTCSLISEKSSESSSLPNLLLFNMSSKCFPNSKNINSGAINSIFFESEFKESTLNTLPLESRQEYNLLVSTTTNIFYFKDCMNLCDKAMSDLSDNSLTSCSVNLDLETICFNLANLSNSGLIILVITKENLNLDNALMSSSNSLGIDIVTSLINYIEDSDYLKLSSQWLKVSELNVGDEIAVPDKNGGIEWVKISSIKYVGEEQVIVSSDVSITIGGGGDGFGEAGGNGGSGYAVVYWIE